MNAPAIEDGRPANFNALDVLVVETPSKKRQWPKADRQSVALIFHREMVKRSGNGQEKNAKWRKEESYRGFILQYPSEDNKHDCQGVNEQAKRCSLDVAVGGHAFRPLNTSRIANQGRRKNTITSSFNRAIPQ